MTLEELIALPIEPVDEAMEKQVKLDLDSIAKPLDSFGVFEDVIVRAGGITRRRAVSFKKRIMLIMIADNGIVAEGISQSGQEVTRAVAESMGRHGSSVCKMALTNGTDLLPVDIGMSGTEPVAGVRDLKIREGTRDFLLEPAMTEEEALAAISVGIDLVKECKENGYDLIGTGEMGIGNTTTSCAVAAALLQVPVDSIVGRGAGLTDAKLAHKAEVIKEALRRYGLDKAEISGCKTTVKAEKAAEISMPAGTQSTRKNTAGDDGVSGVREKGDGTAVESEQRENAVEDAERVRAREALRILSSVGGLDIAGLTGVFIGGALYHIPITIDGVISGAAALLAERLKPGTKQYMLASHRGAEPALPKILEELELTPVIDAKMALGEGTGAVLFFSMLDNVMSVCEKPVTFADISVGQYVRNK